MYLPTSQKLDIFDAFWNIVDQQYGGFPNVSVNWDSLRTRYRPEVAAGVSRGRFYAIMTQLKRSLQEVHVYVDDVGIDTSYSSEGWWLSPLFWAGGGYTLTWVGYGVVSLPDGRLVVYRTQSNNPLGLKPGDIVLGYEGKKWKDILRELDSIQLLWPRNLVGSSAEAADYMKMNSAPGNWHLFDTIDVVRYSTGETVHLPTKVLAIPPEWDSLYCTDQISVPGVSMPNVFNNINCSWGIVEGTSIGYIYAYNWSNIQALFTEAVTSLKDKTTGLILDFRFNMGGNPNQANGGYAQLFNENIDPYYELVHRYDIADHFSFIHESISSSWIGPFKPSPEIYDHPIAVLTGPACLSAGDYNAFRMRFHPMARSFGKRTNTGYVDGSYSEGTLVTSPWVHRVSKGGVYSNNNNENYLIHKGFPVDEEVWLTQAGVVKGEDNVVKRALEWINTVAYAHSPKTNKIELNPDGDSVTVTAVVNNPLAHTIGVSLLLRDLNGTVFDSTQFFNDGLHGDGIAGDSVWGTIVKMPAGQRTYTYSIRSDDKTQGTFRMIPYRNYLVSTKNAPAARDTIYATKIGESRGSLWSIDPTAGTVKSHGEVFVPDIRSLAIRPATNDMYGVSSDSSRSTFYRISCDSGSTVPIRDISLGDIRAIAFKNRDTLYCGTTTGKLYRLNFPSGEAVLVGTASDLNYWALSFSPSGKLWASARHNDDSIYVVNTSTAAAKSIGTIGFFAIPRSIAFNSAGVPYCLIDNGSGEDYLATLDTLTGAATPVSENPLGVNNLSAIAMRSDAVVSVSQRLSVQVPQTFSLSQNYPNPFNPTTVISYQLPVNSKVTLKIYDVLGREVATLVNEEQSAGWKEVQWNANAASGVYFFRIEAVSVNSPARNFVQARKMLLLR